MNGWQGADADAVRAAVGGVWEGYIPVPTLDQRARLAVPGPSSESDADWESWLALLGYDTGQAQRQVDANNANRDRVWLARLAGTAAAPSDNSELEAGYEFRLARRAGRR